MGKISKNEKKDELALSHQQDIRLDLKIFN